MVQVIGEAVALDADAGSPNSGCAARLKAPFQQMQQEDIEGSSARAFSRPMLPISSAICSMSACVAFPREKVCLSRLQGEGSRS